MDGLEDRGHGWVDTPAAGEYRQGVRVQPRVLLVGQALGAQLNQHPHWQVVGDARALRQALVTRPPDAVVLDLAVPCAHGLVQRLRRGELDMPVVAVLGPDAGADRAAAAAVSAGAHLIARPLAGPVVEGLLSRLWTEQRRARALAYYQRQAAHGTGLHHLVGESLPMLRLKTRLQLLLDDEGSARAEPARSLTLCGGTGTGKHHVARTLHFAGARRDAAFVVFDPRRVDAGVAQASLFGCEASARGSPGAGSSGLVEAADGGTLLVREIAHTSHDIQSRLLALIDHQASRRVDGRREIAIDVRVVLASRHSLPELRRAGGLLPALYRRLADAPLELPMLSRRGDDMWLLADRFVNACAERRGLARPTLGQAARAAMARHAWPGNVLELRRALERAVLLNQDGLIRPADLAPAHHACAAPAAAPSGTGLRDLEREALAGALRRSYGNVTRAARLLQISRDTMRYRMAKHGLSGQEHGVLADANGA